MRDNLLPKWNKDGAKNVVVVAASGDKDDASYKASIANMPWHMVPMAKTQELSSNVVRIQHWPMPAVLSAATGAVIEQNAFRKINDESAFEEWLSKA